MSELIVVRHAKAERDAAGGGDRERPLAARGVEAATRLGRFLADGGWDPELVLCSPARRAVDTLERMATAAAWKADLTTANELYPGDLVAVAGVLRRLGSAPKRVVVVGHEPWCSDLVSWLTGGSGFRFPTCASACVSIPVTSWERLSAGRGEVLWMVTPKLIAGREPRA